MLFEKVMVSIDFSKESKLLLGCIDEFKNYGMKEMILVHVVDIRSAGGNASSLVKPNKEKLDKIGSQFIEAGIKSKSIVRIGFPGEEINDVASQEHASMVLVGSHGGGFIKNLFLGSTAFDLLRITDTPLLIERFKQDRGELSPYCRLKFPKVLIATDFSECSAKLMDVVAENKNIFTQIYLVNVIERSHSREQFEKKKKQAEKMLAEIKDRIDSGIEVFTDIKVGNAAKNIIEVAQEEEIPLIMLSKKGQGGTKEILLGSTAQDVAVRSISNAVLVFPC
ncbi:MAG: universal stress protein [Actinomycetota bacterium]|nr:universal stress protein [Actinomycetota bacterium]